MDSIFLLDDGARAKFLQNIVQSFGFTYICLWSYVPQPSNFLISTDGFYNEENEQPSSSAGSLARRRFNEYRRQALNVQDNRIPGLAFKNGLPYMELKELDLQSFASIEVQSQFYQEARIKSAIFMGCMTGEIELGMSNDPQLNMEMEMKNWFSEDFSRQVPPPPIDLPSHPTDQNRPSSSSSSLRSLSMDSPECSPFLFNIPATSYLPEPPKELTIEQALRPISTSITPLHHAKEAFRHILNPQFASQETKEASAMAHALLTVMSSASPSSSSSSHQPPPQQTVPPNYPLSQKTGAFKRYRTGLGVSSTLAARARRQTMQKRAITFFKALSLMRIQERVQGSRPTSTQLHHMISERKRREKLNESFQALRSLLPPGTKKDKASVLASTTEYLTSLKAQVAELTQMSQRLEAQILPANEEVSGSSSSERLQVVVTNVAELTSDSRIIDLQVIVKRDCNMLDLVIRVMEFLKQIKNVNLISVEGDTKAVETNSINRVMLRLRIEGAEWDESAFQEAVRRVVADLAQ